MQHFDAIVIGTGQAGPSLARRLAGEGRKVAVIERKLFGGTCVNTGCTPTKTMVASAAVARAVQRAAEYGVTIGGSIGIDMGKVKARKDAIVAQSTAGVERSLRKAGCTVFQGHARFAGPHEVSVNGETLSAKWIFINAGGRASAPPIEGLAGVSYLTNTSILELDVVPAHLAIIGGSYIGLEFGQMFRRFGAKVTIVEMGGRLIGREDEDVSEAVRSIMENEGINVRLNAKCLSTAASKGGVTVNVDCTDGAPSIEASHLLVATGRRPNTDDLGLEKAGIAMDAKGYVTVDDQLRTNVEGVWALGDCNGRGAFTHTSYNDFEIVAANLLDNDPRCVSDRIPAYALYIDPPLGRAGMTEAEIRKSGRKALAARMPMEDVSRAVEKGETQGFMKIAVDAEAKHILGAAVLGTGGDEIIHCVLDLIYAKAPYTVMQRAVHIHPTVSELIPTMLGELAPL
jgi:pyruvate/2-oxoglutarate dehydrogenase complex dihydrolipoamide dehydrogenase (E3) component